MQHGMHTNTLCATVYLHDTGAGHHRAASAAKSSVSANAKECSIYNKSAGVHRSTSCSRTRWAQPQRVAEHRSLDSFPKVCEGLFETHAQQREMTMLEQLDQSLAHLQELGLHLPVPRRPLQRVAEYRKSEAGTEQGWFVHTAYYSWGNKMQVHSSFLVHEEQLCWNTAQMLRIPLLQDMSIR
eukprot:scaffold188891_cov18-Tisochrysis_lutea.AAC.2